MPDLTAAATRIFGEGTDLTAAQMSARAAVIFIVAMLLVRIAGRRSFAMHSPFDNVIALLLGAVLARAVVGASPFFPTLAAAAVLVLLHRVVAWIAVRSHRFGRLVKGRQIRIFENGAFVTHGLDRALVSREDLREEVQNQMHQGSMEGIARIDVNRNGRIGIVREPPDKD